MKWPSKPSYLLKTKKSDEPSAKLTFTDGFPLVDLSSISEKETFPKIYLHKTKSTNTNLIHNMLLGSIIKNFIFDEQ